MRRCHLLGRRYLRVDAGVLALLCGLASIVVSSRARAAAGTAGGHVGVAPAARRAHCDLAAGSRAAALAEWGEVARAVSGCAGAVLPGDAAEAARLAGMAHFFLGDVVTAERALLTFLRIEPNAHLDPALHPPEFIAFVEQVRLRHAIALAAWRRGQTPSRWLSLLPPLGQWQRGERRKALWLGGALAGLALTNLATYATLRSWCDNRNGVCESGGEDRRNTANALRAINLLSFTGLIGVYAFGVYDGWHAPKSRRMQVTLSTGSEEGYVVLRGQF